MNVTRRSAFHHRHLFCFLSDFWDFDWLIVWRQSLIKLTWFVLWLCRKSSKSGMTQFCRIKQWTRISWSSSSFSGFRRTWNMADERFKTWNMTWKYYLNVHEKHLILHWMISSELWHQPAETSSPVEFSLSLSYYIGNELVLQWLYNNTFFQRQVKIGYNLWVLKIKASR